MICTREDEIEEIPKLHAKVATEYVAKLMGKFTAQDINCEPSTHSSSFVIVLSSKFPASPSTTVRIRVTPDDSGIKPRLVLDIETLGNYSNLVFQYAREVTKRFKRDYQDMVVLEVNTKKPPKQKR